MDVITMIGFFAAGVSVVTMSMQTMVPLRIVGLASNVAFIFYGLMIWSLPVVVLHAVLFPINVYRLREMLKLIRNVEGSSFGDLSMDWLKPLRGARSLPARRFSTRATRPTGCTSSPAAASVSTPSILIFSPARWLARWAC